MKISIFPLKKKQKEKFIENINKSFITLIE